MQHITDFDFLILKSKSLKPNPCCLVVFDRDNTLIRDNGYVHLVEDFQLFEEAVESLKLLNDHGAAIAIATNQGGIALNKYSISEYFTFTNLLIRTIDELGIDLEMIIACPHHPLSSQPEKQKCKCRKPEVGMLEYIAENYPLSKKSIAVFGDSESDIRMAHSFGVTSFKVTRASLVEDVSKWVNHR